MVRPDYTAPDRKTIVLEHEGTEIARWDVDLGHAPPADVVVHEGEHYLLVIPWDHRGLLPSAALADQTAHAMISTLFYSRVHAWKPDRAPDVQSVPSPFVAAA